MGPTQPSVQWVPGLPRGKERPGHDADPSPRSSAMVSTPAVGRTACTELQCLYKSAFYLSYQRFTVDKHWCIVKREIYSHVSWTSVSRRVQSIVLDAWCSTLSSASAPTPHVTRLFLLAGSINGQILYVSRSSWKAAFFVVIWLLPQWRYVETFS